MTDERRQLEPIEDALVKLSAAEDAGVFRPTLVDAAKLLALTSAPRVAMRLGRWATVGLPVAACLGLVVGVGGMLFRAQLSSQQPIMLADNGAATPFVAFTECFGGPNESVASACGDYDYDADGDVDVQDFQAYQLVATQPG